MPGRPRKNLVLLEMSGATKRNPGRYRDRDAQLDTKGPIGEAPEEFKQSSQRIALVALWDKIVSEAPVGLLTASDREYLASVCWLGIEAKRPGRNQLRALQLYTNSLKGLGMTPDGRAVRGIGGKVATKAAANPLDDFVKPKKKRTA